MSKVEELNKESLEHRKRLEILEKHIGKYYYTIGAIHGGISDAMEEYAEAVREEERGHECKSFLSESNTTSITKCKFCGKEKWEHNQ